MSNTSTQSIQATNASVDCGMASSHSAQAQTQEIHPANARDFSSSLSWLRAAGAKIVQANPSRIVYSW